MVDFKDKRRTGDAGPMLGRRKGDESLHPIPGMSDILAGEAGGYVRALTPYLPNDLIGGSVPYIAGTVEDAVWNAASQACGTEKIHFCYAVEEKRVWYLACPSASMASHPDSWCPMAAALPGNSAYWDKETVYLYEQEGMASAMRWDVDTGAMQLFLGASRTILSRVQSMNANFVTIDPSGSVIVPWENRGLMSEKLSRATIRMLLYSGLLVGLCATLLLFFNYISIGMIERNLDKVKVKTEKASLDLMMNAGNAMQSDTIKHLVRVQEILDSLANVDGTLVRYEVKAGRVEWEALVPQAFAADYGTSQGLEKDGRVRVRNTR